MQGVGHCVVAFPGTGSRPNGKMSRCQFTSTCQKQNSESSSNSSFLPLLSTEINRSCLVPWWSQIPVRSWRSEVPWRTQCFWIRCQKTWCLFVRFYVNVHIEISLRIFMSFGMLTCMREYMNDDLNLGWLIHYVSGQRMPTPFKAMGNPKSDTPLIHHMILWIVYTVIWICLSITAAPPKYYHVLLLSSKYS